MRVTILSILLTAILSVSAEAQSMPVGEDQIRLYPFAHLLWRVGEPNLVDSCIDSANTIRLTKSPYLKDAIIISLRFDGGKAAVVRSLVPQHRAPKSSKLEVDSTVWGQVSALLNSEDFWSLESDEDTWITHANLLLVEACMDKKYHAVRRYAQRGDDLLSIVRAIEALPK